MQIVKPPKIQMDDVPLNRFHIKIAGLTFGAHFIDGYVLGQIGFALTQMTPQMGLSSFWQGMLGSSALIGLFIGSLFLGHISDIIGRQKIFCFSFIIITIGTFSQFFIETPLELFLLRIFIGIGLGGDYSVGHTMLAEISPRKHRGILLGSFSVIWTFGYVAANFLGHYLTYIDPNAWRWLLMSASLPAFIILLLRIGTPESPRWLMKKGRHEEANTIIKKYFGTNVILNDEYSERKAISFFALFSPQYRQRTLFNSLFFICLVIPYFAIYTFLPAILNIMGLNQSFSTDLLLNFILIIGALLGIVLTQTFSRRGFLIYSFIFLAICLGLLSFIPEQQTLVMLMLFAAFTLVLSAVSNLVGVFPAESFPTKMRALGVGFATSMSRLGSAIGTGLLPIAILSFGMQSTMLILTGILASGAIISILWAPETKDLSLVEASDISVP